MASISRSDRIDELLQATAAGNFRRMKELAKEMDDGKGMADILATAKDSYDRTVLHVAAQKGWTEICKYLIEDLKLSAINEKDAEDSTPLLRATHEGRVRTVAYLIECGGDPAALTRHNKTALHIAARKGHVEVMRLLLSKGVDVNAPSDEGTPLHAAAEQCKQDVIKVLLEHGANAGADPNAISHGSTPLVYAAGQKSFDVFKCLLDAGADPNIIDELGTKPIEAAAFHANLAKVIILFPVTSPIPACSDWSINGIMKYVHSEEAYQQLRVRSKEICLKAKSEADHALHRKEYYLADLHYTEVITLDRLDATALSNRSLCYACEGNFKDALSDAQACIKIRPEWPEGYYRAGVALISLKKFDMAADILLSGLKLDRENKELRDAFRKAVEGKINSVHI